jgi:hypothetical protein
MSHRGESCLRKHGQIYITISRRRDSLQVNGNAILWIVNSLAAELSEFQTLRVHGAVLR